MDGLEDFNETVSHFTQELVLMFVPKVLHQLRQSVQLHGFDDGSIRRQVVHILGALNQLDAAFQHPSVEGQISDVVIELEAEGMDDVVIAQKCLQLDIMQLTEDQVQTE